MARSSTLMAALLALALVPAGRVANAEDVPAPIAPVAEAPPEVLPRQLLFAPLLADPRWPHFGASLQNWGGTDDLGTVGAVSLGDAFSLYQAPGLGGRWGIGLQAAVFALFDLEAESKDLVNADYWVGLPLAWRAGDWAALARIYHQSSHLGDEYLLRSTENRRTRLNLSFEAVDLKISRDFWDSTLRLYGGAGLLFDKEPDDLKPLMAQWGGELRGPWTFADGFLRPIAALDFQSMEETGWNADLSARLGVELTSSTDDDYVVQLTLEYYRGRNPNGQFYTRETEFWGFGMHAYF